MSRHTEDKFWIDFATALKTDGEKRPKGDGWKTSQELGVIWGLSNKRAGMRAMKGVRAGVIIRFNGAILSDNGKIVRSVWYRKK